MIGAAYGRRGPQGPPGGGGGAAGSGTVTTADYAQPAVGATVTIAVKSSKWMAVGLGVFVENGGTYIVTALPTTKSATIENQGGTNPIAGTVIPSGSKVIPGTGGDFVYTTSPIVGDGTSGSPIAATTDTDAASLATTGAAQGYASAAQAAAVAAAETDATAKANAAQAAAIAAAAADATTKANAAQANAIAAAATDATTKANAALATAEAYTDSELASLAGTTSQTFQLQTGSSGVKLKNSSSVLEARNSADNAYAIVRGGTPVGNDDLTPKSYVTTAVSAVSAAPLFSIVDYANNSTVSKSTSSIGGPGTSGIYINLMAGGAGLICTGVRVYWVSTTRTIDVALWDLGAALSSASNTNSNAGRRANATQSCAAGVNTIAWGTPYTFVASDVGKWFALSIYEGVGGVYPRIVTTAQPGVGGSATTQGLPIPPAPLWINKYVLWSSPRAFFNNTANPHAPNAGNDFWTAPSSLTTQDVILIEPTFS